LGKVLIWVQYFLKRDTMKTISIKPIGIVHSPFIIPKLDKPEIPPLEPFGQIAKNQNSNKLQFYK
jgi:hypothetical protein